MKKVKLPIRWALKRIEKATLKEIDSILAAVLRCHGKLHPEYELVVLSIPKFDREARDREIDAIAACLKQEYDSFEMC